MRNSKAKKIRRLSKMAIEETGATWCLYYEDESRRPALSNLSSKIIKKFNGDIAALFKFISDGHYIQGPIHLKDGCGKKLYKQLKRL